MANLLQDPIAYENINQKFANFKDLYEIYN
jgi:hypothetical protein